MYICTYFQLSPPVLSVIAQKLNLNRSLLVRLHEYYPTTSPCKVHLLENYRSYKEIVDIPSKLFYGGTLLSHLNRPPGVGYPIHFHGVLGREEMSKDQPSYYNMAEVAETVEQVKQLTDSWPQAWGEIRQSNICVLAPYIAQVKSICSTKLSYTLIHTFNISTGLLELTIDLPTMNGFIAQCWSICPVIAEVTGLLNGFIAHWLELTIDVPTMNDVIAQWLEHLPRHRRGHGFIRTYN